MDCRPELDRVTDKHSALEGIRGKIILTLVTTVKKTAVVCFETMIMGERAGLPLNAYVKTAGDL